VKRPLSSFFRFDVDTSVGDSPAQSGVSINRAAGDGQHNRVRETEKQTSNVFAHQIALAHSAVAILAEALVFPSRLPPAYQVVRRAPHAQLLVGDYDDLRRGGLGRNDYRRRL